jgi:hypothetical protein
VVAGISRVEKNGRPEDARFFCLCNRDDQRT